MELKQGGAVQPFAEVEPPSTRRRVLRGMEDERACACLSPEWECEKVVNVLADVGSAVGLDNFLAYLLYALVLVHRFTLR